MKKFLYGTTALAAVGLAAGPAAAAGGNALHLDLSGYYQQIFGFSDTGQAGEGPEVSYQNAEINFNMRGELDNGLKIGGRLELEGLQSGDQIDQAYLVLSGGFGELRIGGINSGRYSYGWNTDGPNVGVPINSGWTSSFLSTLNASGSKFRSPGVSTVIDGSNDDQKLTYFTPRFNGFQLALSWTPNAKGTGGENPGIASEAADYTEGWDLGLSYSGAFDQVGVEVQAGIAGSSVGDTADAAGFSDYLAYNGGLGLSVGPFAVAASFAVVAEGQAYGAGNANSTEGRSFNAGASYSTGPWGMSVTYFNGQIEGATANPGDEENEFYAAAVSYKLGPGLGVDVTFLSGEKSDDLANGANVALGDTDAKAVLFRIKAGF